MTRAFTLFSAALFAFVAFTSAAPVDSTHAIAHLENNVASSPIQLEKRRKHHKKSKNRKNKKTTTTTVIKKKKTTKTTTKSSGKSTSNKSTSSSSSSDSESYSGTATWFKPATEGGSTGACGPEEDDDDYIVALNKPQYGDLDSKSSWCGKKIKITGPAGSATATINDACPECKSGDLDLTLAVFKDVVGDYDLGVGEISWHLV